MPMKKLKIGNVCAYILCIFVLSICCFGVVSGNSLFDNNVSISQNSKYPEFCKLAAYDAGVFKTFRCQQAYREIVETVGYDLGVLFAQEIRSKYIHLLPFFDKICAEDEVGGPLRYFYPEIGLISPTVLRYVKVVGDLQREFGSLNNLSIVEIGGGFGGQCKVINDICGFCDYTIIDLPECTPLITRYLSCFSIQNVKTISCNDLQESKKYDLVISNYAFSEINRLGQSYYMEMIINLAPCGYVIYNHFPQIKPFALDEFVLLLKMNHKNVKVISEDPSRTGDIVIWHP